MLDKNLISSYLFVLLVPESKSKSPKIGHLARRDNKSAFTNAGSLQDSISTPFLDPVTKSSFFKEPSFRGWGGELPCENFGDVYLQKCNKPLKETTLDLAQGSSDP